MGARSRKTAKGSVVADLRRLLFAVPLLLGAFIIEDCPELAQPRPIGLRVRAGFHRMLAVEEVGDGEVGAVLLGDRVGALRIAHVEAGRTDQVLSEAVQHDLAVELRGLRQAGRRDRLKLRLPATQPGDLLGFKAEERP